MITVMDFIIAGLIMSFCAAVIIGTLVYCVLKKKHDADIEWLFNMICNNKTEVYRFYNKYQDHMVDYHEGENK